MDVRKKLVEMSEQLRYCANVSDCVNCKRWDKVCENQCVDNLLLMAADLIDSVAHGMTVQKWIPVTERLPEHSDGHVLVTCGEQVKISCRNACYKTASGEVRCAQGYGSGMPVTHWMPLPEPPKEAHP